MTDTTTSEPMPPAKAHAVAKLQVKLTILHLLQSMVGHPNPIMSVAAMAELQIVAEEVQKLTAEINQSQS